MHAAVQFGHLDVLRELKGWDVDIWSYDLPVSRDGQPVSVP